MRQVRPHSKSHTAQRLVMRKVSVTTVTTEVLQSLGEQVAKFRSQGPMILCGDFNARCGRLDMEWERLPSRKPSPRSFAASVGGVSWLGGREGGREGGRGRSTGG